MSVANPLLLGEPSDSEGDVTSGRVRFLRKGSDMEIGKDVMNHVPIKLIFLIFYSSPLSP